MRNIVICQGDENRAKIEQELTGDIFFANVYKMAEGILRDIIEESEEYKKLAEDTNSENVRYQRVGNNVIAFCASRGQGKTSAMKSFAKYLSNGYRDTGRNDILGKDIIERNEFVVLDSVDPAALDGGESLVRVVISRLFYLLEKKYKDSDFSIDKDKKRLLDLFQECYCSIDYLHGKKQGDDWQDDLEKLAALGSSSKLKRSLIELINLFLSIYTEKERQTNNINHKNRFLVVPIDDMDICVSDIYACCEEIRNYLFLPNVIVLLAADYDQLHRVIYQKYLQVNKNLLKYEKKMRKECIKQASGYLLKLLPSNHINALPGFETMSESDWESLKLVYLTKNDEGKYADALAESTKKCRNLQMQIAKIIYDRTGILFWSEEEEEDFIPLSMRGLTQFVKKIFFRPVIVQQELYSLDSNGNQIVEKGLIENLLINIQMFKNYFLDSWCLNCMSLKQYTEFKEWVHNMEKRRRNGTLNLSYDQMLYWVKPSEDSKKNAKTNANAEANANGDTNRRGEENDSNMDDRPPEKALPHAVRMYLTIFMNEWFAEALRDRRQYEKIIKFIGKENSILQDLPENQEGKQYKVYSFLIENDSYIVDMLKRVFMHYFCRDDEERIHFDFMRPWYEILKNGCSWSERKGRPEDEDTVSKSVPGDSAGTETNNDIDLRLPLKIIIANSGIYRYVVSRVKKNLHGTNEALSFLELNWKSIVNNFYSDEFVFLNQLEFLELKNVIRMLKDFYLSVDNDWTISFAIEKSNQWVYCSQYQKEFSWLLDGKEFDKKNPREIYDAFSSCISPNLIVNPKYLGGTSPESWEDIDQFYTIKFSQEAIESKRKELDQLLKDEENVDKIYDVLKSIQSEYRIRKNNANLSLEDKTDNDGGEKAKKPRVSNKRMSETMSADEVLMTGE